MTLFNPKNYLSCFTLCLTLTACGGGSGGGETETSSSLNNISISSSSIVNPISSTNGSVISSNANSSVSSVLNPASSSSATSTISVSSNISSAISSNFTSSAQSLNSSSASSSNTSATSSQNEIAPGFTQFTRLDTGNLIAGHNIVVEAHCSNCDESNIVYTWFIDGIQKATGTGNTYQINTDDVDRNIRVTALAYSPNHTKTAQSELSIAMVSPSLLKLERLDTGNLIAGQKLIVKAHCKGCLPGDLGYNWYVADVLVGNGDNYLIKPEDHNKKIRVDAVAYLYTGTPHQKATMEFTPVFVVDVFSNARPGGSATEYAALKSNGSLTLWDNFFTYKSIVYSNVKSVASNNEDSAVLKQDGTVELFNNGYGGITNTNLVNVKAIAATVFAFAALKQDGTVITWGSEYWGGSPEITEYTSPAVPVTLTNIKSVIGNERSFVAIRNDGILVPWGSWEGTEPTSEISNVKEVFATANAYAALKNDNSVVTFGSGCCGGDSSGKTLTNVKTIYSNDGAFAALTNDGNVVTWGKTNYGSDSSGKDLTSIVNIVSTSGVFDGAFAALKNDGQVITWGNSAYGGDGGGLDLTNVKKIISYMGSQFLALKNDGSLVIWGAGHAPGKILYSAGVTDISSLSSGGAIITKSDNSVIIEPHQNESGTPENALSTYLDISNTHP